MYQILLKQALEENRSHIQLLKQAVEQMSFVAGLIRGDREGRYVFHNNLIKLNMHSI